MKLSTLLRTKGKDYFYIMHLSYGGGDKERLWNYAKKNNLIGISHREIIDYDWKVDSELAKNRISGIWVRQFNMFCNEMKNDDIVVILDGWHYILGIIESLGDYEYTPKLSRHYDGDFFGYTRKVLKWTKSFDYEKRLSIQKPLYGFNNTLSEVRRDIKWWTNLSTVDF